MATELKPDLVFIAATMKAVLFFFKIIDIDAKLLAIVEYRRPRAAFAGHAGEIIERAQLADDAAAFAFTADERGDVALDPKIRLRVPKTNMLQHRSVGRGVRFAAVGSSNRFGRPNGKLPLHRRFFRIDALGDAFLRRHAHTQTLIRADRPVRNRRGNQHDLTRFDFYDATFAFDLRAAAEL